MKSISRAVKICCVFSSQAFLTATLAMSMVGPSTHSFAPKVKAKVQGVIISREETSLRLLCDDDTVAIVDLSGKTKIQVKKGWSSTPIGVTSLIPGLELVAEGRGNDNGELLARKISFDPYSLHAARQIESRVAPLNARATELESRSGSLEARAGTLENRSGTLEKRADKTEEREGELEIAEVQTNLQVAGVEAGLSEVREGVNESLSDVNQRISDLDSYAVKGSTTVFFELNSASLSTEAKASLDTLAENVQELEGYKIQIAGFADSTGSATRNQALSDERAAAVMHYLEQYNNLPGDRIILPAGMSTSHPAADNKTAAGRRMNRRVEVKLLVNQGLAVDTETTSEVNEEVPRTVIFVSPAVATEQ